MRSMSRRARRVACAIRGAAMMDSELTLNGGSPAKPEPEAGSSSGDGNEPAAAPTRESQSLAIEPTGSQRPTGHKATGPRTKPGKERASRNTTKHGVFSKVLLLPGESPAECKRLVEGLREAHRLTFASMALSLRKLGCGRTTHSGTTVA